jgi:hypothetical protein
MLFGKRLLIVPHAPESKKTANSARASAGWVDGMTGASHMNAAQTYSRARRTNTRATH